MKFTAGVIQKVGTLRVCNFRPLLPLPCTCTYDFSLHPLSPVASARIVFSKEDVTRYLLLITINQWATNIFIKERNCWTKLSKSVESNTKMFALFNCTGEVRINNFGCLSSSLYFYFVTNLRKKRMAYVRFQLNPHPPSPHTCQYAFSCPPSPFKRTYFMDDPVVDRLSALNEKSRK